MHGNNHALYSSPCDAWTMRSVLGPHLRRAASAAASFGLGLIGARFRCFIHGGLRLFSATAAWFSCSEWAAITVSLQCSERLLIQNLTRSGPSSCVKVSFWSRTRPSEWGCGPRVVLKPLGQGSEVGGRSTSLPDQRKKRYAKM